MKNMLNIMAMLLVATFIFHATINYMADNISDFENIALPPKRFKPFSTMNSLFRVEATSRNTWTLLNLSTGKTYRIQDPERQREELKKIRWDLGFQRTKIITNSGATNPQGTVGVVNLGVVDFNPIRKAPAEGYANDSRSWGSLGNKSLSDWYIYRTRTHNIESKKNVYVVRTLDGNFVKMRILNYYCRKNEKDCTTMMCGRDEAACFTIEYVRGNPAGIFDPPPPPVKKVELSPNGLP